MINDILISKSSEYDPAILPSKFGQNKVFFVCPKKHLLIRDLVHGISPLFKIVSKQSTNQVRSKFC